MSLPGKRGASSGDGGAPRSSGPGRTSWAQSNHDCIRWKWEKAGEKGKCYKRFFVLGTRLVETASGFMQRLKCENSNRSHADRAYGTSVASPSYGQAEA